MTQPHMLGENMESIIRGQIQRERENMSGGQNMK